MAIDDIYTVSLLHMNGADTSTTFTDESGKTWTASGNAQIDTAESVFGGASGLFDGNDYIYSGDSSDWQLDGGSNSNEWTIDYRLRFDGDPGTATKGFITHKTDGSNFWSIYLTGNELRFYCNSGGSNIINIGNSWNPASATWYHVAVVKQGTTGYKMFIDGTQIGSTQTDTSTLPDFTGDIEIGRFTLGASSYYHTGWIDELRISKGIARWVSNFTPPTAEYSPPTASNFFMFF